MKLNFTYFITYFGILCVTVVLSSKSDGYSGLQPRRRTSVEGSGSGSGPGADDEDVKPRSQLPRYRGTAYSPKTPDPTPGRQSSRKLPVESRWQGRPRLSPSDMRPGQRDEGSGDTDDSEPEKRRFMQPPKDPLTLNPEPKFRQQVDLPTSDTRRSCKEVRLKKDLPYRPKCTSEGYFEALQCSEYDCFCVDPRVGTIFEKTRTVPKDPIECKWVRYLIQIPLSSDYRNRITHRSQFKDKLMKQINGSATRLMGGHEIITFKRFLSRSPHDSPDGVEIELRSIGHGTRISLRNRLTAFLRKMRDNDMPIGDMGRLNITLVRGQLPESGESQVRRPGAGLLQDDVNKDRRSRFAGDETVDGKARTPEAGDYSIRRQEVGSGKEVGDEPKPNEPSPSKKSRDGKKEVTATLFEQPGIIAAIIGGGIAGFFLTILLILFCIYRIRKKDEGSYALEEPKKTPVSAAVYHSAPTREYYA